MCMPSKRRMGKSMRETLKEKLLRFHAQLANYLHMVQADQPWRRQKTYGLLLNKQSNVNRRLYKQSGVTRRQSAVQLLCAVTSVGIWYILHLLQNIHILHTIVWTGRIHPSRRSVPLFAINGVMPDAEISIGFSEWCVRNLIGFRVANRKWNHCATQKWTGISTDSAAEFLLPRSSGGHKN